MADEVSELSILIDIRAKLNELVTVQGGMRQLAADTREVHEAGSELGALFAQGLGIGSGMEMARHAVELFRESFTEAVRLSSQLAAEVERAHNRLGMAGEVYQTLSAQARAAGTDFSEIMSSMAQFRALVGEALIDPERGTALRQIGLDAQALANIPIERQLEQIAAALGRVSNENVRARVTQELFGRGAAAVTPLLDRLRTEGYDKLRASAEETNAVLGDGMTDALNRASTQAEEAQKRLGVALAPLNLKLTEAKTQLVNVLARNAGGIQSTVEASFSGALASAIVTGIEKGATSIEKNGGWKKSFEKLGTLMAGPFGVGFAVAVGSVIIKELERKAIESDQRQNAFANQKSSFPFEIQRQIPALENEDQLRELRNKAVLEEQAAKRARRTLWQNPKRTEEEDAQLDALQLEIDHLDVLIPKMYELGRAAIAANQAQKVPLDDLKRAQTDLLTIEMKHAADQADNSQNQAQREDEEYTYLRNKITLLTSIIELTKKLPVTPGQEQEREQEILKLTGERNAAETQRANLIPMRGQSDFSKTKDQFRTFLNGTNENKGAKLGLGDSVESGAANWVMSLGTQGEQVANAIQSSLGATVSGISEGIYGWITGAESFGQVMQNLGATIFKTILDTIIQMGVQWLVQTALIKMGILSVHATSEGAKAAATATTLAQEEAKTPVLTQNAVLANAGTFGLSAVIGIALLAALLGAFLGGGFSSGGYTGPGGVNEFAGAVHKGEVVFSQADVARHGGVAALENLRVAGPARATTMAAPSLNAGASLAAAAAGQRGGPQGDVHVFVFNDQDATMRAAYNSPAGRRMFIDTARGTSAEI